MPRNRSPHLKIALILITTILIINCSKQLRTIEGGVRPKKNKFSFSKNDFSLQTNDKTDTTVLYLQLLRNMALSSGKAGNRYQFYRFYQNGRFQISETYENFEDHRKFQNI